MHNQHNKQKYSANDFIRYHEGKMNSTEMHILEKDALNDSFLSDALDGFKNVAQTETTLSYIINNIESINKTKVFPINNRKYFSFMSIAASIVIICFAGYFIFNTPIFNKKLAIADNEPKEMKKMEGSKLDIIENNIAQHNKNEQLNKSIEKSKITRKQINQLDKKNIAFLDQAVTLATNDTSNLMASNINSINTESNKNEISFSTTKDMKATRDIQAIPQTSAAERYTVASDNYQENISIKKATSSILENEEFEQYVKKYQNKILNEDGTPIKGEMTISFKINKLNIPYGIKIEQSLHSACDKEAIRLINQYKNWKHVNNKRTKLILSF